MLGTTDFDWGEGIGNFCKRITENGEKKTTEKLEGQKTGG